MRFQANSDTVGWNVAVISNVRDVVPVCCVLQTLRSSIATASGGLVVCRKEHVSASFRPGEEAAWAQRPSLWSFPVGFQRTAAIFQKVWSRWQSSHLRQRDQELFFHQLLDVFFFFFFLRLSADFEAKHNLRTVKLAWG